MKNSFCSQGGVHIIIEVCDLCKEKEPNHQFKIKMSRKGYYQRTGYGIGWVNLWQPYDRIVICEDCAEKLFDIKSSKTIAREIVECKKKGNEYLMLHTGFNIYLSCYIS